VGKNFEEHNIEEDLLKHRFWRKTFNYYGKCGLLEIFIDDVPTTQYISGIEFGSEGGIKCLKKSILANC
jgi:hypothetical protein